MLRCRTPTPPCLAMATAMLASVTVSMAEDSKGSRSEILLVSLAVVSASLGMSCECAGSSSTSSKVSAGEPNLASSVMSLPDAGRLAMRVGRFSSILVIDGWYSPQPPCWRLRRPSADRGAKSGCRFPDEPRHIKALRPPRAARLVLVKGAPHEAGRPDAAIERGQAASDLGDDLAFTQVHQGPAGIEHRVALWCVCKSPAKLIGQVAEDVRPVNHSDRRFGWWPGQGD